MPPRRDSGAWRWAGAGLFALLQASVVAVYYGLGPPEAGSGWWAPTSFLIAEVPDETAPALALLVLPAAALCAAVLLTTRSALLRFLAVSAVVAVGSITFYGVAASGVWSFFHWRWTVCIGLFSLIVGAALCAPLLAERWRRLSGPLRWALYLPLLMAVVAFMRNVTGTDPTLFMALAPWPAVQILGLDVAASILAALLLGATVGLFATSRRPAGPAGLLLAVGGVAVAAALPALVLQLGSKSGFLPFSTPPVFILATGAAGVLLLGALALPSLRHRERLAARAHRLGLGALLLTLPLLLGQGLTRLDYSVTRDDRAQQIIDALAKYREREDSYPDQLTELVTAGELRRIPTPQIGFSLLSRQDFVYQDFGDNYVLEFSAPRWIQCAYSPPYAFDEDERAELDPEDLEELSGGSWSCPSRPPELW